MIAIDRIRSLPKYAELALMPYSAEEFRLSKEFNRPVIESSHEAYLVSDDDRPLLACGYTRPVFVGPQCFWFLLCDGFSVRYAKQLAKAFHAWRPSHMQTDIERTYINACRFATFFGFRPTGVHRSAFGRDYEIYEVR